MPVEKVPLVKVRPVDPVFERALPSVHAPPTPFSVMLAGMLTPFVVMVFPVVVALNVIAPVAFQVMPAARVIDPETASVGDVPVAKVGVSAETVMSRQSIAPVIVTVYAAVPLELASKKTLSAAVGTAAPAVAAFMVWEATVPLVFIVQVLPDPPVIVPMLVFVASRTVMPMTSAGDPTVVSVVPERDAVNDRALAADQLVVVVVSQVPVPPNQ